MLDRLTSADFLPYLHQTFRLYPQGDITGGEHEVSGESLECELIEVSELGRAPDGTAPDDRRRSFSLVFRGPFLLPQRIYTLEHEALGRLALFLVPIGAFQGYIHYQAVFN